MREPWRSSLSLTALEKARNALIGVKSVLDEVERDERNLIPLHDMEDVNLLLRMGEVQAAVAQAESLESAAESLSTISYHIRKIYDAC